MVVGLYQSAVVVFLTFVCVQSQAPGLRVGGLIQGTGIGARGKAAFELVKDMMNSALSVEFVETLFEEYDGLDDYGIWESVQRLVTPTQCEAENGGLGCVHALVCPYTTGASKKVIDAVPENLSELPILVWGGATDSIFTETCMSKNCFGGLTVASQYMEASLMEVLQHGALTVATITNDNGFSKAVDAAAQSVIAETDGLTLVGSATLEAYKSELTLTDHRAIRGLMTEHMPDVFTVSGHPGDVEEIIETLLGHSKYTPKAVIATNAFTDMGAYADPLVLEGVTMPEQWAEDPEMADSITGWTSETFRQAIEAAGQTASYHAASAGGLAVMLAHAMSVDLSADNLVTKLKSLPPTNTFYGTIAWNPDGSIMADLKPMYGKQMQISGPVIVAPAMLASADLMYPMRGEEFYKEEGEKTGGMTCGEVKEAYKASNCCGNPSAPFSAGRRLVAPLKPEGTTPLLRKVREAIRDAKQEGGARSARLEKRIMALVERFLEK